MAGKDKVEIFNHHLVFLCCVLVSKKDPTSFMRSKNVFQFSSDLNYTHASFRNTDKSNDERIVKAEAKRTKMKVGEKD